jgi:ATP-dependent Lhr-like helicase
VVLGEINSDGFTGLRALLLPAHKKSSGHPQKKRHGHYSIEDAGRWSLLHASGEQDKEHIGRVLLRRYGVVFRRLLENETGLPPWRDLLTIFRRLEDRGEVRGGRFVDGYGGEQFALPEVIPLLRKHRNHPSTSLLLSVTAVDPVNLSSVLPTGQEAQRLAHLKNNRVLYRNGVPIAYLESGEVRWLTAVSQSESWPLKMALTRRTLVTPQVRSYLAS